MGSLNKVQIIGNLGRDAELKYTSGGQAVSSFNVATTEKWTGKDGQKNEKTEWHRCTLWGKTAESLSQYLVKGKQIYAEGKLSTRSWDDKDGNKKYTTEINVQNVVLLGGGGDGASRNGGERHVRDEDIGCSGQAQAQSGADEIDDIPFAVVL